MVVVSIPPQEFGPNDHRVTATHFILATARIFRRCFTNFLTFLYFKKQKKTRIFENFSDILDIFVFEIQKCQKIGKTALENTRDCQYTKMSEKKPKF